MVILITVACLVLAATPGGASMCSDADGMSDEIRKAMLDKHNELRSLTAKGLAVNFQGGYAPKAARMLKMSYDCDIEANTMNWIKQCKWGHNSYQERNNWGQNLFRAGGQANKLSAAVKSVESWFNELTKKGIKPGDNNRFTDAAFSTAGHYTQVVWQKSHKLGCAVYWCPGMTYGEASVRCYGLDKALPKSPLPSVSMFVSTSSHERLITYRTIGLPRKRESNVELSPGVPFK
ncbi:C-type single domain activation associated secreted protein ASP3 [Trichostrongylus colubriformis]|uniref:C-type single domain activation associated secreted protein ASP3 n=1 Tax=Trichostrongylus colubriformis TaxID=6319 RepID=A0AAN8IA07_TRICO